MTIQFVENGHSLLLCFSYILRDVHSILFRRLIVVFIQICMLCNLCFLWKIRHDMSESAESQSDNTTVLPQCFQSRWVPGRGFSFRAMMWIYASVITWCLVHLIPKYKALDCWLPTPKVGWVFCSWFWVLCLSSSAGLLNVPDISKCCERARLDNKRQKFRRSHPTI